MQIPNAADAHAHAILSPSCTALKLKYFEHALFRNIIPDMATIRIVQNKP